MKFAILCLALFVAYTYSQEPCLSAVSCRHTQCDNSTGWRVTCHHVPDSRTGFCLCSQDTVTGKSCKLRTDCDLTADCANSFHSVHCQDEVCVCMNAPNTPTLG